MGHFAKVLDGIVVNVIVAETEFFNEFVDESPGSWIQTSYNTHGGVHSLGGTPLRKNYAGIGYSYNVTLDAFIPAQPFPSWSIDETTCLWEPPVAMPETGGPYKWNEELQQWDAAV